MKIELRKPEFVMKLDRLGSFHQSKLSFLRSFIREFKDWDFQTHELKLEILDLVTGFMWFKKETNNTPWYVSPTI